MNERQYFDAKLHEYSDAVNGALSTQFAAQERFHPRLRDAMLYSLMAGGKRLRPALTLSACELFGGDAAVAMPFACAVEMIHTYSLIHDDLPAMDDDDYRRGKPSCHRAFGEATAILAGDALLTYAFELMAANCNSEESVAVTLQIAKCAGASGMIAGQILDLEAERGVYSHASLAESLRHINRGKTGALLTASLTAGALIARADAGDIELLEEFGEVYGQLFQLTDDLLDAVGEFGEVGKTLQKDAAAQKLTWISLYGLDAARARAQELADDAALILNKLGRNARFLLGLLDFTVSRSN
ncbi:MAG: polyprenyl synthetase family protein [Clostridia bacterium]|nr:polyprenyl synthetase family protein [Clostridia bacterium]